MPQIKLEYSENLTLKKNPKQLMNEINELVSSTIDVPVRACKNRIMKLDNYFVGDDENEGIVHIEVKILEGKTQELKEKLGSLIHNKLKNEFIDENKDKKFQITAEILDIIINNYVRFSFDPE